MYITKTVLKKKLSQKKWVEKFSLGSPAVELRGQSQARGGGISKMYEEKEKEGDKGEGMEGERKGEETETIITSVDMEDGESVI